MKKTTLLLLAGVMLMPRPASAGPSKEYLQLLAEMRMLEEQNAQMQQLFGSLQDALKAVSAKLDDQVSSNRKATADQTLAITNMGDTVRVLREKADDTNVRISTVSQEIQALRQALASQPPQGASSTQLPLSGTAPGAGDTTGASMPSAVAATPVPIGISPQRAFDSAFDDFSSGRYDTAIQGFQLFIQTFPTLPQAAIAQFNIGASYYNQGKWNEARDAFTQVTQKYPQDAETNAQAYFKLGQTYEQLKQPDLAKKAYETVAQKFPTSFQAAQANQALLRLNRK
ncbi:MAG TPA: tetratricopeptide repeat protein [Vicinamibacterales bacterium]|jgi:tol-pal system protein YbgF